MALQAQYTTTTPAFGLTTAPDSGVALPLTDPSAYGDRPQAAYLQATTADIRFTADGSVPTSSHGMVLTAGAAPFLYPGPLIDLQFIQAAGGAVLEVLYVTAIDAAKVSQVASFNARTGAIALTAGDVTSALTYTPADLTGAAFSGAVTGTQLDLSGAMTAATYSAGAVPGVDFSGAITTLTVVKGIVTAAA